MFSFLGAEGKGGLASVSEFVSQRIKESKSKKKIGRGGGEELNK